WTTCWLARRSTWRERWRASPGRWAACTCTSSWPHSPSPSPSPSQGPTPSDASAPPSQRWETSTRTGSM
ncbi:unnamed protein product, partial [Arctogadus glacialis]